MEQFQRAILIQALENYRKLVIEDNANRLSSDVPIINYSFHISQINELIGKVNNGPLETIMAPASEPLAWITKAETHQSGGNCYVDLLTMQDGTVLSITDESVVYWASKEDYYADAGDIEEYTQMYLETPTKMVGGWK